MAYDNSARAARARETRARVLDAAAEAFLSHGYGATTIRGVAERAGVSPEAVYKGFRNKATLLKTVYDRTLAGDDEPIPLGDRPGIRMVVEAATARSSVSAYATLATAISNQVGPLLRLVYGAHGTDPDLAGFLRTIDGERLRGTDRVIGLWAERGWLRPDLDSSAVRDIVWVLNSTYTYLQFRDRGWTDEAYVEWLSDTLMRTVMI